MRLHLYPAWSFVGVLLVFTVAISSLTFSLGNRIESGRWVAECLEKKTQAILNRSPTVVILSGSTALFGFSAKRLSEEYGVESVNAGVHAGLGLRYILDYGRKGFAKNRIFVLSLEYELYGKTNSDAAYLYQVIGFDPGYFRAMSLSRKIDLVRQISLADRARLLFASIRPYPRRDIDGYQSRTLNAWGDETNNTVSNTPHDNLLKLRNAAPKKYSNNESAWAEIEAFVSDAKQAGARVIITYPNIYAKALDVDLNRGFFSELEARAFNLDIPIIGHPKDSTFDDDAAFDTIYHQNSIGQSRSTDQLILALKKNGML